MKNVKIQIFRLKYFLENTQFLNYTDVYKVQLKIIPIFPMMRGEFSRNVAKTKQLDMIN